MEKTLLVTLNWELFPATPFVWHLTLLKLIADAVRATSTAAVVLAAHRVHRPCGHRCKAPWMMLAESGKRGRSISSAITSLTPRVLCAGCRFCQHPRASVLITQLTVAVVMHASGSRHCASGRRESSVLPVSACVRRACGLQSGAGVLGDPGHGLHPGRPRPRVQFCAHLRANRAPAAPCAHACAPGSQGPPACRRSLPA